MPVPQFADLLSTKKPNTSRYNDDVIGFPDIYQHEPGTVRSTTMPDNLARQVNIDLLERMAGLSKEDQASFAESTGVGGDTRINREGILEIVPGTEQFKLGSGPGPGPSPEPGPTPGPVKPPAQKVRKKFSSQMAPEALIAALMSELGFSPEETSQTSTSRYNAAEEETPTLGIRGTPGDQWMGWLNALLEDKKRKESIMSKTMSKTMSNRSLR